MTQPTNSNFQSFSTNASPPFPNTSLSPLRIEYLVIADFLNVHKLEVDGFKPKNNLPLTPPQQFTYAFQTQLIPAKQWSFIHANAQRFITFIQNRSPRVPNTVFQNQHTSLNAPQQTLLQKQINPVKLPPAVDLSNHHTTKKQKIDPVQQSSTLQNVSPNEEVSLDFFNKKFQEKIKELNEKANLKDPQDAFKIYYKNELSIEYSRKEVSLRDNNLEDSVLKVFLTFTNPKAKKSHVILNYHSEYERREFIFGLHCRLHESEMYSAFKGADILLIPCGTLIGTSSEQFSVDDIKKQLAKIFNDTLSKFSQENKTLFLVFQDSQLLFKLRSDLIIPCYIDTILRNNSNLNCIFVQNSSLDYYAFKTKYPSILDLEEIKIKFSQEAIAESIVKKYPECDLKKETIQKLVVLCNRFFSQNPKKVNGIYFIEKVRAQYLYSGLPLIPNITESTLFQCLAEELNVPKNHFENGSINSSLIQNHLQKTIKGQPYAIQEVASSLCCFLKGLNSKDKPAGVFLFAGPTGTGKTQLAKTIAEYVSGSQDCCEILDMGMYHSQHTLATLFGSPSGYVDSQQGGKLAQIIKEKKPVVLLFDEIEKAHRDVLRAFLPLFDEGRIQDLRVGGQDVSANNIFLIMTTNVGAQEVTELYTKQQNVSIEQISDIVSKEFSEKIGPEWIGRMQIIPFQPHTKQSFYEITELQLQKMQSTWKKEQEIMLTWSTEVIDWLLKQISNPKKGGRSILEALNRQVSSLVANLDFKKNDHIYLSVHEEVLMAQIIQPPTATPQHS